MQDLARCEREELYIAMLTGTCAVRVFSTVPENSGRYHATRSDFAVCAGFATFTFIRRRDIVP